MEYLEIPTWKDYQHYKDRCPPWIKLHFSLLSSPSWVMLSDASKLLAVVCMMLASRNDGKVPNDPTYLKRVAYLDEIPDLLPLIKLGFLVNPLADASTCNQPQAKDTTEERRGEERIEEKPSSATTIAGYSKAFESFWQIYPKRVNKGSAWKSFKRINPEEYPAIRAGIERKKLCDDWLKDNGKFIPHPATWLNARGWEDEDSAGGQVFSMESFMRKVGAIPT